MHFYTILHKGILVITTLLVCTSLAAQTNIYWVGGSGDWDDLNMWYKDPAGTNLAGILPNSNTIVNFTNQSSATPNWQVRLQPGAYDVHSIVVSTFDDFRIYFNGTSSNTVSLTVYGDIDFLPTHRVEYASSILSHNKWVFDGPSNHNITSGGQDLLNIEIKNENGSFNQLDDLTASLQIRMFAGTWNSNGHDVTASKLLFEDDQPSSSPLTKLFNAGTSDVRCDDWESGFTYGSLVVTGNHTIRTSKFRGSPKQVNGPPSSYHNIYLLELSDTPNGGVIIEYNNFECRNCIIESIRIEDTGDTKLADEFTVNGSFTVVNEGSSILFNGGNNRTSEVTFNGPIITPKVFDCSDTMAIFSSVHTDETIFIRNSGTLQIRDAILNNIQTQTSNSAAFDLVDGVLQGASTGWNLVSSPDAIDYYWRRPSGTMGNWDDPNNWVTSSGLSNGCIPTIKDDVYIDNTSKGQVRIPRPFNAACRNLYWSNEDDLELILDGTGSLESSLTISGNMDLDESAIITPIMRHEIYFSSSNSNYIRTQGVQLPEILFIGNDGEWILDDDLFVDQITFEAGTFNTNGRSVETDVWNAFEEYPKHFDFGASHIIVNGIMDLAEFPTRNVSVNPGTSLIECEVLNSVVTDLYDVQFNNTSTLTMGDVLYDFHTLLLNGSGEVRTVNDLTLDHLEFVADGSTLAIDAADSLIIHQSIESLTSAANPGELKSKSSGTQASVHKYVGNLCVAGNVELTDIDATDAAVFHAPDGIDGGNNTSINFASGINSSTLYWIAQTGGVWQAHQNWSTVNGGCPSNKDPRFALSLVFNSNSFSTSPVTVEVSSPGTTANQVTFMNAEDLAVNIQGKTGFGGLTVEAGFVNFIGSSTLAVFGNTKVKSAGFLTSELDNLSTETLQTESGVVIVKDGATFEIKM